MEIFFRRSRAANSVDLGQILANFEPIQAFIAVLVICKNEKDQNKIEGARVLTTLYIYFSNAQGQLTQLLEMRFGRNSNSFKLLWLSLSPARMKKIQSKMKALECSQHFSHYKSMEIFQTFKGTKLSRSGSDLAEF